jgi:hypothetical protein
MLERAVHEPTVFFRFGYERVFFASAPVYVLGEV